MRSGREATHFRNFIVLNNKQMVAMRRMRGVTLIEMMVALVVGLIVSGAALALVIAIMKSSSDTIRATRLTQELRATTEIVARDLRRARSVVDPIANIDTTVPVTACNTVTVTSGPASCVVFGYDCVAGGGTYKAIGLAANKVRLATAPPLTSAPACPMSSTDIQLSSDTVRINSFSITKSTTIADSYTISLTGRFANDPSSTPLIRSFSQIVRIRSVAVN